jgi:hypothetical protein
MKNRKDLKTMRSHECIASLAIVMVAATVPLAGSPQHFGECSAAATGNSSGAVRGR